MKKIFNACLMVILGLGLVLPAWAGDAATREECVAKSKEAAEMVKKDKEAAIKQIGDKQGPFVWKDTYVFLMDLDGKMLAHPMKPELTEKGSLLAVTDKNADDPKLLFAEFVEVAKNDGEGWVEYMWPKPGEDSPSVKETYVYRVPGTDLFTAAGVYK